MKPTSTSFFRFRSSGHYFFRSGSANNIRRSRRLFPVGPVMIVSPSRAKKLYESLSRNMYRAFSPMARLRSNVSPSATAPAAGLFPSTPSVPALSTAIFFPAIFFTHASTNDAFLPPMPLPFTGELSSPSAITATRCRGLALRNSLSCANRYSAAVSTGQSSVALSQHATNPSASVAWCAGWNKSSSPSSNKKCALRNAASPCFGVSGILPSTSHCRSTAGNSPPAKTPL